MSYKLIIGNKNYSSWSLRAWWFLRMSGIEFEEVRLSLDVPSWLEQIARWSPAKRVPVLIDGEITVWDSAAIYQYVLHAHPSAVGYPEQPADRALALSLVAEMNSGFSGIRTQLPQNIRARRKRDSSELWPTTSREIARVDSIWSECRQRHAQEGPWLFGTPTLADVVFAPVALRFVTYGIEVSSLAASFIRAVSEDEHIVAWCADSAAEQEQLTATDSLELPAEHHHHAIDYIELTVADMAAAKAFYSSAFGWQFNDYGLGYAGIRGPRGEMGGMQLSESVTTGGPLVVLYSSDIELSLRQAGEAGATITKPIFEFPGGRRFHFTDPSGNELAVWTHS